MGSSDMDSDWQAQLLHSECKHFIKRDNALNIFFALHFKYFGKYFKRNKQGA